jgi:hypothetical protein
MPETSVIRRRILPWRFHTRYSPLVKLETLRLSSSGPAGEVEDINPLRAALVIPVEGVEGDAMRVAVDQVDVDGVGRPRPGGGNAIGGAGVGLLQRTDIGGRADPGIRAIAGKGDLRIGGIAGDVVGDGEPIVSVDSLPGSLGRRVSPVEKGEGSGVIRFPPGMPRGLDSRQLVEVPASQTSGPEPASGIATDILT